MPCFFNRNQLFTVLVIDDSTIANELKSKNKERTLTAE